MDREHSRKISRNTVVVKMDRKHSRKISRNTVVVKMDREHSRKISRNTVVVKMDREHSRSRSRSPIKTHDRHSAPTSSKRALSSESEDETKHSENTPEKPADDEYSGSYMLVKPILFWFEYQYFGAFPYIFAFDAFDQIIYTIISNRMISFCAYENNLNAPDSESLEEIEDSDQDDSSTDRTYQKKEVYKELEPLYSLKRERKKWLGKEDLLSRPWHAKLALFLAKEENGGLTSEELNEFVKIYAQEREPPFWKINARVAQLALEFFNQTQRNRTSSTKVALYDKLLNLAQKYPSRLF